MDRIDDERVRFYLRHQEDIEQWSMLRSEASRTLDTFLQDSAKQFQALAPMLGKGVATRTSLKGKGASYIRFLKPQWVKDNKVRATIGVEWPGPRVLFFPRSGSEPAYVSIWVNRGAKGGTSLVTTLRNKFAARAKELGFTKGASTSWHPVWQYQSPKETEYWDDLAPFRQQIIDQIQLFWDEFAAGI